MWLGLNNNLGAYTICKVCTANIHLFTIKDKYFEMNTRTEDSLQTVIEYRLLVKIFSEVLASFFSMNKPHLHTAPNELGDES